MSDVLARVQELVLAAEAEFAAVADSDELEQLRVKYLGRKAELPNILRGVSTLPAEQRGSVGKQANQARKSLEQLVAERSTALAAAELSARLAADRVDITLPGAPRASIGYHHLLSSTRREIEGVFLGLGFRIVEGPEIESVKLNFDALNHTPTHPARGWSDTFYINDNELLRTHTSPVQVRMMQQGPPPLYVIAPGRVYRRDSDATHTPQFHQIEGLAIDADITLTDLKGVLLEFARAVFGQEREIRLRPHFFPFTEPSVEVDVSCFKCTEGRMADDSQCSLCKGSSWIEILGAGMVDPNVLEYVREYGYDPEAVQGFAFGMGIDRIAMLKYGIPHLRFLYDNDMRFNRQFP